MVCGVVCGVGGLLSGAIAYHTLMHAEALSLSGSPFLPEERGQPGDGERQEAAPVDVMDAPDAAAAAGAATGEEGQGRRVRYCCCSRRRAGAHLPS